MMDYKPGTVATATVRGVPNMRVMLTNTGNGWVSVDRTPADYRRGATLGNIWHPPSKVTDVRPLVVLDPEDPAQVGRLLADLRGMSFAAHACGSFTCLQSALRSLTKPPKPPEPTGLGAVVEDDKGEWWVRDYERGALPWRPTSVSPANGRHAVNTTAADRTSYASINAVKVLAEGVTP